MKKKTAKTVLLLLLIVDIIFIVLDIANVSNYLSFIQNLNCEWVAIIINCSVVIVLYLFTFIFVDDNAKKKEKNKKDACRIVLISIYENCYDMLKILGEKENVIRVVKKCNFDVPTFMDDYFIHLQNSPFELEKQIFDYANSGIMSKEKLNKYMIIKNKYKQYLNMRITFYDAEESQNINFNELSQHIQGKRLELLKEIEIELSTLKEINTNA